MSQGEINESKLRLHALDSTAVRRADSIIKAQPALHPPVGPQDLSQTTNVRQTGSHKTKKVPQTFADIRDSYKSMVQLIDNMFDSLQEHIYTSNKSINETQLQIDLQRPTFEKQNSQSWLNSAQRQPAFIGKIYTYDWSLIIKGANEEINCYVIPSDRVISFNSEPEIYRPYLTICFRKQGANFGWQIEGKTLKAEHLDELTNKIFDKLLKSIKNQEYNESAICLPNIGVGLAIADKTSINSGSGANYDPEQILADLMKAAQESLAKPNEFKITGNEIPAKSANTAETNTKLSAVTANESFDQTLKLLLTQLAPKLAQLVDQGSKALNEHDFQTAQKVLTLTNQLDEFKQKAEELLKNL